MTSALEPSLPGIVTTRSQAPLRVTYSEKKIILKLMSFVKQIFYVNAFITLIDKVTVFEV